MNSPLVATSLDRFTQNGFSLIEVMVATILLGLCVTGVMTLLGSGSELETSAELRRQARIIVQNTLEESSYNNREYPYSTDLSKVEDTSLYISAEVPVAARLTVVVSEEQIQEMVDGEAPFGDPVEVYYQTITAKVEWPRDAPTDFVELNKRVADTR